MNVGSLFSGIGGIDLGLERAGMRVLWQCESDPYARAVLRKHWPEVPCYEDVRRVGARNLVPVDLICGGFPCQDISAAGLGVGLGGERSGLWFHFARILGEARPEYAIIESTPPAKRWVPVVRRHLWAAGYSSLPLQLRAADFGAPHLRKRLFILAHAPRNGREPWWTDHTEEITRGGQPDGSGLGAPVANPNGSRELQPQVGLSDERRWTGDGSAEMADADGAGLEGWDGEVLRQCPSEQPVGEGGPRLSDAAGERTDDGRWFELSGGRQGSRGLRFWDVEPDVGRVAHGVPSRVDRLRCLGNAVVPQIAEYLGHLILQAEH